MNKLTRRDFGLSVILGGVALYLGPGSSSHGLMYRLVGRQGEFGQWLPYTQRSHEPKDRCSIKL